MVIPFDRYLSRRVQKEDYRKELVAKILAHHRASPNGEREDSMYLDHVRSGFPIDVLEGIVQKLEQEGLKAGGE